MAALCDGLVRASPERPCDDVGGLDAALGQAGGDAAEFLDGPADEVRRLRVGFCRVCEGG